MFECYNVGKFHISKALNESFFDVKFTNAQIWNIDEKTGC
jgi:hypothetical protein